AGEPRISGPIPPSTRGHGGSSSGNGLAKPVLAFPLLRRKGTIMSTSTSARTFRYAEVAEPGGTFALVEREPPEPGPGRVRVTVEACGVCRSDAAFINAAFPDVRFPLVPGHEIAGRVDAVGDGVDGWKTGDRVAVGWFGGNCGACRACRAGDLIHCARLQVPGRAYPGGYAD